MKILQQRFIYYDDSDKLHEVEDKNSLKSYRNFVQEFVNKQNIKKHYISNSLNIVKNFLDDLMIIENDKIKPDIELIMMISI